MATDPLTLTDEERNELRCNLPICRERHLIVPYACWACKQRRDDFHLGRARGLEEAEGDPFDREMNHRDAAAIRKALEESK